MGKAKRTTSKTSDFGHIITDEVTKKKVKKHLSDINDVISENDIRNAAVPGKEEDASNLASSITADQQLAQVKKLEDGSDGNPVTSWDVLNK